MEEMTDDDPQEPVTGPGVSFMPTPEQIRQACLAIQAEWSDAERERRHVGDVRQPVDESRVYRVHGRE
jgi:hypothetical protein